MAGWFTAVIGWILFGDNLMKPETSMDLDNFGPAMSLWVLGLVLLASVAGAVLAILILPSWLPGLSGSLQGSAPQAFWFLSRSSAVVAYVLLWISMDQIMI